MDTEVKVSTESLYEGHIPFILSEGRPNKETVSAILEAERIAKDSSIKGYKDVDELFSNLDMFNK